MKMTNLVGTRFKESPADCVTASHAVMIRGGYMKQVANGIYSALPPLKRITRKIEAIIRQEMDALDGQEVLFPVAMPASLWAESGRIDSIGGELLRFIDRTGTQMVLGMTHEEAAVHLVREYGNSHAKYPFMVYQIQTKFRDELRPRAGLIRVREFTMKDAYSFHTSMGDLEAFYDKCLQAYHRIFARAGIPQTAAVCGDSGMMGGSISHEFMLLTPAGEDTVAVCKDCGYAANTEAIPAGEGSLCPACKKGTITLQRGIEVGNIFQLGEKYTKAMGMTYTDEKGEMRVPVMGCYGIGVGRLAASVCEVCRDENGPIWPMAIAPWQVHLCALRIGEPQVRAAADALYAGLQALGVEVLYDDRAVSAGQMFADADLLGIPLRVIISPRSLQKEEAELAFRDKTISRPLPLGSAAEALRQIIAEKLNS